MYLRTDLSKGDKKMAIKKLTTKLKNKTWTNQQIKNHKNSYELRLIIAQT